MSPPQQLRNLPTPVVLPSLLMCDFGHLQREIEAVEAAGARALHLDVMDGHFVPNLTYGLTIVEAVRKLTRLPLDVHLMIGNPDAYLERYVDAGADLVTIHREAVEDPRPLLERLRALGVGVGLAFNPPTATADVIPYLELCDLVLVMSVMPGFGGQKFDPTALKKLRELQRLAAPGLRLEVDGGVNAETIQACAEAGATWFVVGSAIFNTPDYTRSVNALTRLAQVR